MIFKQMFSGVDVVPGQQVWTTPGPYSFTVPAGCFSICAVAIGGGGGGAATNSSDSSTAGAGGAGALAYSNSIPVTPGEVLTVVCAGGGRGATGIMSAGSAGADSSIKRGATTILLAKGGSGGSWVNRFTPQPGGNSGLCVGDVCYSGGNGAAYTSSTRAYGGQSGTYTRNGYQGGVGSFGGFDLGADLLGGSGNVGRGGDGVASTTAPDGLNGGVRIIWGKGRSYPDNAVDTLPDVIPFPNPTPANFGDVLDGGFYAGMVWERVATASNYLSMELGNKTFVVPDMGATPLFYIGQDVEIRYPTSAASKAAGVVLGAKGTTLTIKVLSVVGPWVDTSGLAIMARHRIVVAPKAGGENGGIAIRDSASNVPAACATLIDGRASTDAMKANGTSTNYPAAHWARGLTIGGYDDWYIPARDEFELCWRNLKPSTDNNYVTADRTASATSYAKDGAYGDTSTSHGVNNNSAPTGVAYTTSVPGQTAASAFKSGGAEAFDASGNYWTSTSFTGTSMWVQDWSSSNPGRQTSVAINTAQRVRAIRRSVV